MNYRQRVASGAQADSQDDAFSMETGVDKDQMELIKKMVEESEDQIMKRVGRMMEDSEERTLARVQGRQTDVFGKLIRESEKRIIARVQVNQMDVLGKIIQQSEERIMSRVEESQTDVFKTMIQESEDKTAVRARRAQMDLSKRMMQESEGWIMAQVRDLLPRYEASRDQQGMVQEGPDHPRHHSNNGGFGSTSADGRSRNSLLDQQTMKQQGSDRSRHRANNRGVELFPSSVRSRNAFQAAGQDTSRLMKSQVSTTRDKLRLHTDKAREEPESPGCRTSFKIATNILSKKPPISSYQLAQITRPWFPSELTGEKQAQYDSENRVVSAMTGLTRSIDDMGDMMNESTLNLWNLTILVYQESPYWLLSAQHGFSCAKVNDQVEMGEITHEGLWPLEFVHQLTDIIEHPFFAHRPNGAFFRLALQFAIACRYPFPCAWDISDQVEESGIECPVITTLQEDMQGTVAKSTDFLQFVMHSGITVYQRLGLMREVFEGDDSNFFPSKEAEFLLELGRLTPAVPGVEATEDLKRGSSGDKRCVFFVTKGDLDKIQQALHKVAADQSISEQVTTIKTSVHSDFRAISHGRLKEQLEDAYRHELHLRKAFNDRMALQNGSVSI
ncbi:unnamed protein product [Clonostachys rosea]|uniref:Uncharacterized protein n=1 Tax=Bionectria ochroleuca TaxID=29856 RepID=A0ABY6TYT8_BIOOC|nr:unnamed protein product [Clonostachys rosea]